MSGKDTANRHTINTVGYSAFVIAVLTLASRFVGLLRIRIFASHFGAGQVLDTYYAAFRIPDFLMGIVIVGTLSIAALPIISEYAVKGGAEARRLTANLLNFTFLGMAILCGLAALFAPWLVKLVAPGFSGVQALQVILLTRIILSAQIILAISNVLTTSLNATKRFFWAGVAPIMYNLGLIAGVVWFYPKYGLVGLGFGVVVGAVLHLLSQLIDWWGAGFRFMPVLRLDAGMRAILKLYIPRLFTLDLSQISLLLASFFGSLLATGSIAVYSLGFDIQAMPVGVFAIAVATASFPYLSDHFAKKDIESFVRLLRESMVRILFYMLPITVILLLLRAHIVRILYGAGQFSWDNTRATFGVLGVLAFSMVGQSLVPLFSRALLARHNTWAPVVSNILSIIVTICTAALLVPKHGIEGVAWGYAVGMTFNALLSYAWLRTDLMMQPDTEHVLAGEEHILTRQVGYILFSVLLFAVTTYGVLYLIAPLLNTHTWVGLVLQTGISVGAGGLVYVLVGHTLNLPDAKVFVRALGLFKKI